MEIYKRPNRSDIHLSKEEEARIEGETKDYFDGLAPKRHSKPQRSEPSARYIDPLSDEHGDGVIPELVAFQQLERDSKKLVYDGIEVREEFVETEYYKDLNDIDKQHHTTGTGFIKAENANARGFSLEPDTDNGHHAASKGNPATNDWIPAANDMVNFVSDKPRRSDS